MKDIVFHENSKEKLVKGVNTLADAVKTTFGANGQYVVVENAMGQPNPTKDGVTVAESIYLKDHGENMGAQILKQSARQTAELAGDGTTSSIILAQAIVNEGMKAINEGAKPIFLKREIEEGTKKVVESIKNSAIRVNGDFSKINQISIISANNDVELGNLITDAFKMVGEQGVVSIAQSKSHNTYIEHKEGFMFKEGYASPYFMNTPKNTSEYDNPLILITDYAITYIKDIQLTLGLMMKEGRPIVIIAPDYSNEAISFFVANRVKHNAPILAIKAPYYGDQQVLFLEDVAACTGGTFISKTKGMKLDTVGLVHLGQCERIISTSKNTTIVGGEGDTEIIAERIKSIQEMKDNAVGNIEKEFHQDRYNSLVGGVAVIYVGGATEVEMKEKKDRVDDAVKAIRSAIEEGYGVGGGLSYYNHLNVLDESILGEKVLKNALTEPIKLIHSHSGVDFDATKVTNTVSFNGKTNTYEDLLQVGVIDPIKVTRVALENAVSSSMIILMTNCLVLNESK